MVSCIARLRQWLVVSLVAIIGIASHAQVTVNGEVIEATEGLPVVGAVVTTPDSTAVSGVDGRFRLLLAAGGNVNFWVSAFGFAPLDSTLSIPKTGTVDVQFKLLPNTQELDIVVVSAGKFEQNLAELTVSMEVVQPALVEGKNTLTMDDVLQQTPGVVIVDSEPQIRGGSGYSFGAGSRVQVLVDDLPILSGDAGRPSWGFLPVENVEQIEVIKGASSVLYGSSALSGVINVRTAWPGGEPETRIQTYHGAYSDPPRPITKYWENTAMVSGVNASHTRTIGAVDLVFGLSLMYDDSYKGPILNDDGTLTENGYDPFDVDRYNADQRARFNVNSRWQSRKIKGLTAGINTNWLKGESLATLLWENDSTGLYGSFDGAATRTKQVIGNIDPFIEFLTDKGVRHTLRGRWQSLDNDNDNDQGNFSDVLYGSYQYQQRLDWLEGTTLTGGIVGQYTTSRGELYAGGGSDGNNTASNAAAYLQVDQKVTPLLNVSAGVRFERFTINEEEESKPVFRAGANYRLAEETYLRASYGQGYRFPSIAEKFISTAVGIVVIYPSPEIQSETSWNAEVGFKQGFRIGQFVGYADVAAFMQRFDNFIEFTFGQWSDSPDLFENFLGLGFRSLNTGTAQVTGIDFSVLGQGNIGKVNFTVLAGYTFTDPISTSPDYVYAKSLADPDDPGFLDLYNEVTYANSSSDPTGNQLKYRMQHLVRADLQATWRKWTVGASFRYNSSMRNIDKVFIDLDEGTDAFPAILQTGIAEWQRTHTKGDGVVDGRISWQFHDEHKVALVVNNALNREYAIRPLAIEPNRSVILQYLITL